MIHIVACFNLIEFICFVRKLKVLKSQYEVENIVGKNKNSGRTLTRFQV